MTKLEYCVSSNFGMCASVRSTGKTSGTQGNRPGRERTGSHTISGQRLCCHRIVRYRRRTGITLLEVILAVAILGMSMAALGTLVQLGARAAIEARDLSQAQILCDSKMGEIRAGILPLQAASGSAIETAPDWQYSVVVAAADLPGLLLVQVTVSQDNASNPRSVAFSLTRFMPDPDFEPEPVGEK